MGSLKSKCKKNKTTTTTIKKINKSKLVLKTLEILPKLLSSVVQNIKSMPTRILHDINGIYLYLYYRRYLYVHFQSQLSFFI